MPVFSFILTVATVRFASIVIATTHNTVHRPMLEQYSSNGWQLLIAGKPFPKNILQCLNKRKANS